MCNLSIEEKQALFTLKNNHELVIYMADKGGGIVVQNKTDYVKEAHRLLLEA